MNASVNIGLSKEFRLSRALLVYGKSSFDGYPYRHPFITLHDVAHDGSDARLKEGRLVTPEMLLDLLRDLGRDAPPEILPERVLVRAENILVWWRPARQNLMFFSENTGDKDIIRMSGKLYPHPPLVFKASEGHLWVRALTRNRRPEASTALAVAPYWNCYDNAAVCTGSMRIPKDQSCSVTTEWEQAFFASEFTHGAGLGKRTSYRKGFLPMWRSLERKCIFPARYLVDAKETLAQFVANNDSSYRNLARQVGA